MTQVASDIILSIQDLETSFGSRVIHSGLNLDIYRGELLVLFGGSGTGKSTLLRSIIGLEIPKRGSILWKGQTLNGLDDKGWRQVRRTIGYSFQNGALFDSLTVKENLEYPLREFTDLSASERVAAVKKMLARVGLPHAIDLYPAELSGGMQKRVGMARTLMLDPELVLYDEPTAGLDPANCKMIASLIEELKGQGKTGILVTHDVVTALSVADRIAYLQEGKIAVTQKREEIDQTPDERLAAYMKGDVE